MQRAQRQRKTPASHDPSSHKIAISSTPRGAAKLEQLHKAWDRRPDGLTIVSAHARFSELMELLGMALIEMASLLGGGASMFNDNVQRSAATRLFPCAAMPCVGPRAQDFDLGGGFYYSGSYPRWCFNTVQKWAGRLKSLENPWTFQIPRDTGSTTVLQSFHRYLRRQV